MGVTTREGRFTGAGGADLAYVHYYNAVSLTTTPTALVYLHGIESHAAWFDVPARRLAERGYDVFCLDRRGSGINREARGLPSGHTDSYRTLLADIGAFVRTVCDRYASIVLVGLSWGGKLALAYALECPQHLKGLVLITPGLRSRVDLPLLSKLKVLLCSALHPRTAFPIPIAAEMFTTTPEHLAFIRQDPLRLHRASARFLFESWRLERFIRRRIERNRLPIQLFLAGEDRIIDNAGVQRLLARGAQDDLDMQTYADQTHSIQFDAPDRLVNDMCRWLAQHAGPTRGETTSAPERMMAE